MDFIALSGNEAAMPAPEPTSNADDDFGIGTKQDNSHENGLAPVQASVSTTNPQMVADTVTSQAQQINNGIDNGMAVAPSNVFAKSANNDPSQTVEAGMLPGMGMVGGADDDQADALAGVGFMPAGGGMNKLLLVGGVLAVGYFLFFRKK